ncbi:hypothetical protein HHI36_000726 [Cryptolaemus montrouzieri]|uniref:Uncharacterized protein n=1 Tax=Cryptolaemus montrouzieri TaxID=559131 RepID=A0ABD2P5S5_9CUCU
MTVQKTSKVVALKGTMQVGVLSLVKKEPSVNALGNSYAAQFIFPSTSHSSNYNESNPETGISQTISQSVLLITMLEDREEFSRDTSKNWAAPGNQEAEKEGKDVSEAKQNNRKFKN